MSLPGFRKYADIFVEKMCKAFALHLIFSTKNFCVLGYKVVKHFMSWPLNELVKLTML